LTDADFLVLNETTSDLDSSLEKEVQASIETMDRDYGIIRYCALTVDSPECEPITPVEQGKIIESDSHSGLLADDREYAELYTIQSKR
jgi:subfamily B ATP-binding cassette protein MsbA